MRPRKQKTRRWLVKTPVLSGSNVKSELFLSQSFIKGFKQSYKELTGMTPFTYQVEGLAGDCRLKYSIWDINTKERFNEIRLLFLRGSSACFIVYDVTNRESFLTIDNWFLEVVTVCGNIPFALIGLIVDATNRQVSTEEGEEYTLNKSSEWGLNIQFFEAVIDDERRVKEIFYKFSKPIVDFMRTPTKKRRDLKRGAIDHFSKILKEEKELSKIGKVIATVRKASSKSAVKIVKAITIRELSKKIAEEEGLSGVGLLISDLRWVDPKFARRLLKRVTIKELHKRVLHEEKLQLIRSLFEGVVNTDLKLFMKLMEAVTIKELIQKIAEERLKAKLNGRRQHSTAMFFIRKAAEGKPGEEAATRIIEMTSRNLRRKDEEESLREIGKLIAIVAQANPKHAATLIEESSEEIRNRAMAEATKTFDEETAQELAEFAVVEGDKSAIEAAKEEVLEPLGEIGLLNASLASASPEVTVKLINEITIALLQLKVADEKSLKKIVELLTRVTDADSKLAEELILEIFDDLIKKVTKEEDIRVIGKLISIIPDTKTASNLIKKVSLRDLSKKVAKERLTEKLSVEDLLTIIELVGGNAKDFPFKAIQLIQNYSPLISGNMAGRMQGTIRELVESARGADESTIITLLNEAIEQLQTIAQEETVREIGSFIANIAKVDSKLAMELIKEVSEQLRNKIGEDLCEEVELLTTFIARASYEVVVRLIKENMEDLVGILSEERASKEREHLLEAIVKVDQAIAENITKKIELERNKKK